MTQFNNLVLFLKIGITENRCIELHSPDGIHSCILRASDSQEALIWFNALHLAMTRSTQRALQDANCALGNIIGEFKHIGWLSRRDATEQVNESIQLIYNMQRWKFDVSNCAQL